MRVGVYTASENLVLKGEEEDVALERGDVRELRYDADNDIRKEPWMDADLRAFGVGLCAYVCWYVKRVHTCSLTECPSSSFFLSDTTGSGRRIRSCLRAIIPLGCCFRVLTDIPRFVILGGEI